MEENGTETAVPDGLPMKEGGSTGPEPETTPTGPDGFPGDPDLSDEPPPASD
ncbi:MAG: hypothetical protein GY719_05875 [bacterium]|nr:hypothetical protein [bacterium]